MLTQLEKMTCQLRIKKLDLSICRHWDWGAQMSCQDVARLSGVLANCPGLFRLDLGHHQIGAEGAGKLAGELAQCPALSRLKLEFNQIGCEGAGSLADVLPKCRALSQLWHSPDVLGPAGSDITSGRLAGGSDGRRAGLY